MPNSTSSQERIKLGAIDSRAASATANQEAVFESDYFMVSKIDSIQVDNNSDYDSDMCPSIVISSTPHVKP